VLVACGGSAAEELPREQVGVVRGSGRVQESDNGRNAGRGAHTK
jgi:hypothetical protein